MINSPINPIDALELKIPNHKLQIPNKSRAPISNDQKDFCLKFRIWVIGIYLLFGAWDLVLIPQSYQT
jgi:hypothetical protein